MKTTKFIPLLEEALKEQVSEILMFGRPGTGGSQIFFKYPQGYSVPYRQDVPFIDLQNFARGLKPAPNGHLALGRNHIVYQIEMASEMTQIHLSLKYPVPASADFDLAPHVFESIFKPGAFSIVSGSLGSGRTHFLEQLVHMAIKRKKLATCIFEETEFELPKDVRLWTPSELKVVPPFVLAGADILLVDLKSHVPADELLKCAERGIAVVLVVSAPNVIAGIFRALSLFRASLARERFSQTFECGIGLYAVKGTTSNEQVEYINEICLSTAEIRADLLGERFEHLFKRRTFNQTLLQYLLKRKIDLKAGFQLSPDPEELDQLLKKIGF